MSEIQSYANQLNWTIKTKEHLNELTGKIIGAVNGYGNMVNMLHQQAYVSEELKTVQSMHQEFYESAQDLIKHIEGEHLAYVDKQGKHLQGIIASL